MSDEPDFATFKKAPLEAYKTLFEKFLKAKGDNEKVCGLYLELSDELEETKDKLEAWVTRLKKLQSVDKWTDQQTLDAATMALNGPAGEWWSYLQRMDPTSIDTLQKSLKEFQVQFKETASAVEAVKCISNLSQHANEPGKDFFFRVGNSTYLSCRKALEAVQADVTLTTAEHGFNACLNHFSRVLFINGLKSGVKPIIEAKFSQLTDTKTLLAAVVEAEVAAADRRDRVRASEMEISALQKQAETWQS